MAFTLTLRRDELTPALQRLLSAPSQRGAALLNGARVLESLAKRAFDEPSLRPAPWAPHSKKHAARRMKSERGKTPKGKKPVVQLLKVTGNLMNSIRAAQSGDRAVVLAPVKYAAAHQFGYKPRNLPARPFLPAKADGKLTDEAGARVAKAIRLKLESLMGLA